MAGTWNAFRRRDLCASIEDQHRTVRLGSRVDWPGLLGPCQSVFPIFAGSFVSIAVLGPDAPVAPVRDEMDVMPSRRAACRIHRLAFVARA